MKAPQIVMLCLQVAGLMAAIHTHGKEKKENAGVTMLAIVISNTLLWWGGWFR